MHAIASVTPAIMSDPILDEWQGRIRAARSRPRRAAGIRGGGTKDFYGAARRRATSLDVARATPASSTTIRPSS